MLDSWNALPFAAAPGLLGDGPLLVVAPHPDDEALGCGGLIADCVARQQPVHVLVLTDGAGSHPNSKSYPKQRLVDVRAAESRAAMGELGLPESCVAFGGLPDTRAPLSGARLRRAAQVMAEHAAARRVTTILTSWPGDPHHDHLAAYRIAALAAATLRAGLFCYPVWGWTVSDATLVPALSPRGFRLDISAHLAAKRRAIACYRSQLGALIDDDPEGFSMSADFVALFTRPFEVFVAAATGAGE